MPPDHDHASHRNDRYDGNDASDVNDSTVLSDVILHSWRSWYLDGGGPLVGACIHLGRQSDMVLGCGTQVCLGIRVGVGTEGLGFLGMYHRVLIDGWIGWVDC